jgi:hypothetical protein
MLGFHWKKSVCQHNCIPWCQDLTIFAREKCYSSCQNERNTQKNQHSSLLRTPEWLPWREFHAIRCFL